MTLLKNDRKFDVPKAFLKEKQICDFSAIEKKGKTGPNFDRAYLSEF